MNEQDDHLSQAPLGDRLKHLVFAAQQHPKKSRERQRALQRLIIAIQQSGKLCRPRRGQFQGFYQDIYAEAVQQLFAFICERIDDYNPQKGEVMTWVNVLLDRRFFIEASREVLPTVYDGVNAKEIHKIDLEDLDRSNPTELNPQLVPSLSEEVARCLEEDPEGIFESTSIAKRSDVSFRYLALQRLAGYSWEDLAQETGIRLPTLSGFYQKWLTRFAPKFKEYLL